MVSFRGSPAAWPMAFMMVAAGVPRNVAWPTAEANAAAIEAADIARRSWDTFSTYRTDGARHRADHLGLRAAERAGLASGRCDGALALARLRSLTRAVDAPHALRRAARVGVTRPSVTSDRLGPASEAGARLLGRGRLRLGHRGFGDRPFPAVGLHRLAVLALRRRDPGALGRGAACRLREPGARRLGLRGVAAFGAFGAGAAGCWAMAPAAMKANERPVASKVARARALLMETLRRWADPAATLCSA